jgi:hypothetical protein
MNRTLKRPMFRMGGSVNSGITSGLDQPRKQYSQGTDPYDRALTTTERAMKDLERFKGENTRSDRLLPGNVPNFLTSFGLNLMSQTPRGKGFSGLLSTAATAAKEPFQTFQAAQLAKKDDEMKRAEDLFSGALASEYDLEEQRIKNQKPGDDSRLSPEVERDIITNAQQTIFDQRAIINDPESTPDEIAAAKNRITINQNVLVKELGVPPEYAAILGDPDLFGDAMADYVQTENKRRIDEYVANNPGATPKQIQDKVPQMQEGTAQARDFTIEKLKQKYYYNDGGRVGLAFGGDPMMPEVAEAPQEQVQDLSYTELRSRLPQEISNDIVQLLANSKQALMDFANIQTGEDIAAFNQQYDVNLTLPQGP